MEQETPFIIPVYLFLGFLEAGKTKFMQKMLEDSLFAFDQNVLLLVCEEGEEEFDTSRFAEQNVYIHSIEDPDDLNPANLTRLADECDAGRIFIEYNGMWHLQYLIAGKPDTWSIYQTVLIAETASFLLFRNNFRSLVTDKLSLCDLVYFNRFEGVAEPEELHRIVREVNCRVQIYYEFDSGQTAYDDIVDPLPFDKDADPIVIEDAHYTDWYQDIGEHPQDYAGKRVTFKALIMKIEGVPSHIFGVGRDIMTCCVEDMQFCGFAAEYRKFPPFRPHEGHWVMVTARVRIERNERFRRGFPVLEILTLTDTAPVIDVM